MPRPGAPSPVVTSSWDDGNPLDMRLAELLERTGMSGTFYVSLGNPERPVLGAADLRALDQRFELGAHTRSHVRLTGLDVERLEDEVVGAKRDLEDLLGRQVTAFCYPGGRFSARARAVVRRAGFAVARTTVAFRRGRVADPFALPVTLQAYPHSDMTHLRHALREGNFRGARHFVSLRSNGRSWVWLALAELERALQAGDWWHLWGHSWEIEELGVWSELETVLAAAGTSGAAVVTNTVWGRLITAA